MRWLIALALVLAPGVAWGQSVSGGSAPIATTSVPGIVQPDGTTVLVNSSGVISASGGTATSVTIGTTTVGAGTTGNVLYDNAGTLGNLSPTITINSTACSLGGSCTISAGGSGTVNSGAANQIGYYATSGTAISGLNLGNNLAISGGAIIYTVPDSTSTTSVTVGAPNMGGQLNVNGASLTVTIPAISSTVFAQGDTLALVNQNASAATISSTPTINGVPNAGTIRTGGFLLLTSNGTSLDAVGFPGFGTITANALPKFLGADGGLGASSISDNGSSVTIAEPVIASSLPSGTQVSCLGLSNTNQVVTQTGACGTGGGGTTTLVAPQGRLTLTSNAPVMSADVASTSTIYYDAYVGNSVPYYNGTTDGLTSIPGGQVSTVMQTTGTGVVNTTQVADIFFSGGHSNICIATDGAGNGWAGDTGGSNTARGTGYSALTLSRGYWTNANSVTHCYNGVTDYGPVAANQLTYLGSVYTTGAGVTTVTMNPTAALAGTNNVIGIWNAYNRLVQSATELDSTTSYTSTSTTWHAANNSNANRVTWVDGLAQSNVNALVFSNMTTNGGIPQQGVDCDAVNVKPTTYTYSNLANFQGTAPATCQPNYGVHFAQAVDANQAASNTTYYPANVYALKVAVSW